MGFRDALSRPMIDAVQVLTNNFGPSLQRVVAGNMTGKPDETYLLAQLLVEVRGMREDLRAIQTGQGLPPI